MKPIEWTIPTTGTPIRCCICDQPTNLNEKRFKARLPVCQLRGQEIKTVCMRCFDGMQRATR